MSPRRGLGAYVRAHGRLLAFLLLSTALGAVLSLITPAIIGQAIDAITRGTTSRQLAIYGGTLIGLTIIAGGLRYARQYGYGYVSRMVEYRMRNDLVLHLQKLQPGYYQVTRTGDLMARLTNDLSAVRMMLGPGLQNGSSTLIMLVLTVVLMFTISVRLAAYCAVLLPLVTIIYLLCRRPIDRRFTAVQEQFATVSATAQESFSGIRVVKAFAQEPLQVEHFRTVNQQYVDRSIHLARVQSVLWPAMMLIVGIVFALVIWLGGTDVVNHQLTLGQYVQFSGYLTLLVWPMIALGWTTQLYQEGMASMRRLRELFEIRPAIVSGSEQPEGGRGEVEFRDVSFGYGSQPVLSGISFRIPAEGSLGIVGHTGTGKTTIAQLLLRMYDVDEGQVLVDGIDVRAWRLDELRRRIGYVPQETFLFSDSLAENIALGVDEQDASRQALDCAARVSRLENDLPDFPHGLETVIGERGVTLSGGQKQRTAIARAVIKDPTVLILDDALSAVDTSTAQQIINELREVMRGRTTIIISHRISAVQDCDEIVVLDEGHIAERGTHLELIRAGREYARIYRRQLLREEMDVPASLVDDLPRR